MSAAENAAPEGRMNAARAAKAEVIAELRDSMSKAASTVVLGFKGMDVAAVTELRTRFRSRQVVYKVVKNNLVRQALKGSPLEGHPALDKVLVGETAIAFSFEDPSLAAKVVRDFRKVGDAAAKLEVKAGILESTVMVGEKLEEQLASLPGKDELRATLLATLQAPAQNFVRQLKAPLQNFAFLLDARRRQLEEQAGGAAE